MRNSNPAEVETGTGVLVHAAREASFHRINGAEGAKGSP
jgi:hypothetical protein